MESFFDICQGSTHDRLGELLFIVKSKVLGTLETVPFSILNEYEGETTEEKYTKWRNDLEKVNKDVHGLTVSCSKCGKALY
jgi:hypothetical protein